MFAAGERVPEWLGRRAALSPHGLALVHGAARYTFAGLDAAATRAARRLAAAGAGPGERVALLLRNSPAFVELVHAVARLGAILVPVNVRLSPAEIRWQLADVGARLLLFDEDTAETARAVADAAPGLKTLAVAAGAGLPGTSSLADLPEVDVALRTHIDLAAVHSILYTSGTTGRPKGALLTYGNHFWNATASLLRLGLREDDRWLACLPLFHVGGLAILLRSVLYGIPVVLHDRFDPAAVNRAIDSEGITLLSVVSNMLARMLDERSSRPYPPSLRCVLLGGGPAPAPLLEECARRRLPVAPTYGLTEAASQVATLLPSEAAARRGSAGRPLFFTEVAIEVDGRRLPPGEVGEILVRGPTVSPGYYGRPEENARTLRGGWFRTGDLGYLDGDGYLYVLDRRDDLIVSGGENVYPAEVEAVLLAHPAVLDAGVTGIDDPRWGKVPVAAVRVAPGVRVSGEELIEFCRARLARYKVPRAVRFVDELPRNASGKLLRRALREAWSV